MTFSRARLTTHIYRIRAHSHSHTQTLPFRPTFPHPLSTINSSFGKSPVYYPSIVSDLFCRPHLLYRLLRVCFARLRTTSQHAEIGLWDKHCHVDDWVSAPHCKKIDRK